MSPWRSYMIGFQADSKLDYLFTRIVFILSSRLGRLERIANFKFDDPYDH